MCEKPLKLFTKKIIEKLSMQVWGEMLFNKIIKITISSLSAERLRMRKSAVNN